MARVLVTEAIAAAGLDLMRSAGHEVAVRTDLTPDDVVGAVSDVQAMVIRSATRVTAEVIDAAPDLQVLGRAGVGIDNVDVERATAAGVLVVNAPDSNVMSAAEYAMALILAVARNIPQAHSALSEGRWERSVWVGTELSGKQLGIVGFGRVGRLVARRARAFDMTVVAHDPYVTAEQVREHGAAMVELDELLASSDFVSLHLARTPETIGLLDATRLAQMKRGVRVVNVARGGIVDEVALADGIRAGRIGGAALDVFGTEPLTESPLFELPQVIVTPHLGASTAEAQERAGVTIAEEVTSALAGEPVRFAVNRS